MIRSIYEVKDYVANNGLERTLNASFNRCHINSPKVTFYSVEKINRFCLLGLTLDYENYYNFLSEQFPAYPKFSAYLKDKVDYWKSKDESIDENDALVYLMKKFIVDPIDGKISELETKQIIEARYPNFTVTEPTPEEDMRECFDFKLDNGSVSFFFQHKPKSFFYNLKERTKHSFLKVERAAYKHQRPIFFTKKEKGKVFVYIRNKNNKNAMTFIPIEEFHIDVLAQSDIDKLARLSFKRVRSSIIDKE